MSETDTVSLLSFSDIDNSYYNLQKNTSTSGTPLDFHLSTVPSLQGTTQPWKIVSPEMLFEFLWYTTFVFNQIIGIIGILGSIASVIVLKKNGLDRMSNVLLFVLAIADACSLCSAFHIGKILLIIPGKGIPGYKVAWKFSYTASYVAYIVYMASFFLSSIGSRVSTYITVLITLERLIAVFFPLQFHSIVTPRRVWLAIAMVTLFWLPWSSFVLTRLSIFKYGQLFSEYNSSVGLAFPEEYYEEGNWVDVNIIIHFSQLLPLIIVTIGSIIISIKIGLTLRKRLQLTQSKSESTHLTSRTTRTLLMVCLVFSVTRSSYYLQYLPWFSHSREENSVSEWFNLSTVYAYLVGSLAHLNNAVNFFIYVGMNKNFRKTFLDLLQSTLAPARKYCCFEMQRT